MRIKAQEIVYYNQYSNGRMLLVLIYKTNCHLSSCLTAFYDTLSVGDTL